MSRIPPRARVISAAADAHTADVPFTAKNVPTGTCSLSPAPASPLSRPNAAGCGWADHLPDTPGLPHSWVASEARKAGEGSAAAYDGPWEVVPASNVTNALIMPVGLLRERQSGRTLHAGCWHLR